MHYLLLNVWYLQCMGYGCLNLGIYEMCVTTARSEPHHVKILI